MSVRGVRGATTVTRDEVAEVLLATENLALEMAKANGFEPEDIASVIVSTTPDLKCVFPAKAVRSLDGWKYVPVMCTHEMDVPGGMPMCIRIMMHVNLELKQMDVTHIYQNEAIKLRPDLQK